MWRLGPVMREEMTSTRHDWVIVQYHSGEGITTER